GHRAAAPGDDRRPLTHRLDHHEAERFGPVDGEQKRRGVAEKLSLFMVANLTDELDQRMIELRANHVLEIFLVGRIDLRGDLQWEPDLFRNFDRPIWALLGRDAAEECEIAATRVDDRRGPRRQSMLNRSQPVGGWQRKPLIV